MLIDLERKLWLPVIGMLPPLNRLRPAQAHRLRYGSVLTCCKPIQTRPYDLSHRTFSDKIETSGEQGPLKGIRVLDFSRILAVRIVLSHNIETELDRTE